MLKLQDMIAGCWYFSGLDLLLMATALFPHPYLLRTQGESPHLLLGLVSQQYVTLGQVVAVSHHKESSCRHQTHLCPHTSVTPLYMPTYISYPYSHLTHGAHLMLPSYHPYSTTSFPLCLPHLPRSTAYRK